MPSEYEFAERLAFSRGVSAGTHPDTIRGLLGESCVVVRVASHEMDLAGVDFIATLRRGAELNIDIKARAKGCSRFWKDDEPDIALEIWSVRQRPGQPGKCGWSLDEAKITDYTLHVFDPSDTREVFLLPFQLLRIAFRTNISRWMAMYSKPNGRDVQSSGRWESECVFVPSSQVIGAISQQMRRTVVSQADPRASVT